MRIIRAIAVSLISTLSFVTALLVTAAPAQAQATRTWVSGVGDDVNPCSRTAPCKTFAGAISKTAAGGEIDCLDPGGFGTLTVTKSITIDCTGTLGSTLNSGGINGFVINDSATVTPGTVDVILRGITIDGAGTTPGLNGVRFISGRSLVLQDVFIQNQSNSGISFQPQQANAELFANNVTITDTGTNGVIVQPTGTGSARVGLSNVRIENYATSGFRVDTTGNTGAGIRFDLEDVVVSGGTNGVSVNAPAGTTGVLGIVHDAVISHNSGTGILIASSNVPQIRVGNTTITANGTGVNAGTAQIISFGTNRNFANVGNNNGSFSSTIPQN
jgi:hypothetical protein